MKENCCLHKDTQMVIDPEFEVRSKSIVHLQPQTVLTLKLCQEAEDDKLSFGLGQDSHLMEYVTS